MPEGLFKHPPAEPGGAFPSAPEGLFKRREPEVKTQPPGAEGDLRPGSNLSKGSG